MSKLFFDGAGFFVKSVRAMPAAALAAIAAFEVIFFGETLITFGRVIKIFAFNWFIFVILFVHGYKPQLN